MKKDRHARILEIIGQQDIETQEELADALRRSGCDVTQATVSRDIRDLRLTKVQTDKGHQKYVAGGTQEQSHLSEKYIRVLREGFLSMDQAENILVIKTVSGMAMAVAAAIDAMHFPEVVGCIAGDDTIMAAIRTAADTPKVMEKLRQAMQP